MTGYSSQAGLASFRGAQPTVTGPPVVIVDAAGISIRHGEPMTKEEARHVALRLLEAATEAPRELRRPAAVDEALRDREGGV